MDQRHASAGQRVAIPRERCSCRLLRQDVPGVSFLVQADDQKTCSPGCIRLRAHRCVGYMLCDLFRDAIVPSGRSIDT